MHKTTGALVLALALAFSSAASAAAPKKTPSISFQGVPQYTQQELLTAAGIHPGARLSATEVRARARQLNDTGLFASIKFTASSRGVVFTLTPASTLYPVHLDNLPLAAGQPLEEQLRQKLPLYHGQLPASGSIVDAACALLQQMLADQGIQATVKATLTSDLGPKKITAVNFSIASPAVRIGQLQLSGVSVAMRAQALTLVGSLTGSPFDTDNSAVGIEHAFHDLYQDQGYLAAQISLTPAAPVVSAQSIDIPYQVSVRAGSVYKFGAIRYPADAPLPRAAVDKALARYAAGSGRPLDLFLAAVHDAYHASGYLDCTAASEPVFNEATHIADYRIVITPGAAYKLGAVHFDGAPDPLAARLQHLWSMAPGSIFDESYANSFAAFAQKKDKMLGKWLPTVLATVEVKTNPETQQADCTIHFSKIPAGK